MYPLQRLSSAGMAMCFLLAAFLYPLEIVCCVTGDGHAAVELAYRGVCSTKALPQNTPRHIHGGLPPADFSPGHLLARPNCHNCEDFPLLTNSAFATAPRGAVKLHPRTITLENSFSVLSKNNINSRTRGKGELVPIPQKEGDDLRGVRTSVLRS